MRLWQRPRRRQQAALPGHMEQEQNARGPTRTRGPAGERRRGVRGPLLRRCPRKERGTTAWGNEACYLGVTRRTPLQQLTPGQCSVWHYPSHLIVSNPGMENIVILSLQIRRLRLKEYRRCALIVRRLKKLRITNSQFGALSTEFEGRDGSRGLPNLGEVALTFLQPERPCSIFLELTDSSRRQPLQWTIFEILSYAHLPLLS